MKKRYAFSLNKKENIVLKSSIVWNKITVLQEIQIIFQGHWIELVTGEGIAVGMLQDIVNGLEDAIQNKRMLSNICICKGNLGLYAVKDFASCILEQSSDKNLLGDCLHQSYRICATKKRSAWVYNNLNGNIILEITPWFEPTDVTKQKKYEEWLQQYRPIVKRIIAVKKARKIAEQIKLLLQTVRVNGGLTADFE